jgi:hypothetical protein
MPSRAKVGRHVVFTVHEGRVLNPDKQAVADFLGSSQYEEEFSTIGGDYRKLILYLRRIAPNRGINLYRGISPYGGGCEEWILAELESMIRTSGE